MKAQCATEKTESSLKALEQIPLLSKNCVGLQIVPQGYALPLLLWFTGKSGAKCSIKRKYRQLASFCKLYASTLELCRKADLDLFLVYCACCKKQFGGEKWSKMNHKARSRRVSAYYVLVLAPLKQLRSTSRSEPCGIQSPVSGEGTLRSTSFHYAFHL